MISILMPGETGVSLETKQQFYNLFFKPSEKLESILFTLERSQSKSNNKRVETKM